MSYSRIIALMLIAFGLAACGSSEPAEGDIQTAIALTVEAGPTITPVVITKPVIRVPLPTHEPTVTSVPTLTPEPTMTPLPTAVPLSEIDLEPILVQPGDLPGHLEPEQISRRFDESGRELPTPANYIFQNFYDPDGSGGAVSIFLYENLILADTSYSMATAIPLHDSIGNLIDEEIGERRRGYGGSLNTFEKARFQFLRCGAFVDIIMADATKIDIVIYARHLDERLIELLCPE